VDLMSAWHAWRSAESIRNFREPLPRSAADSGTGGHTDISTTSSAIQVRFALRFACADRHRPMQELARRVCQHDFADKLRIIYHRRCRCVAAGPRDTGSFERGRDRPFLREVKE